MKLSLLRNICALGSLICLGGCGAPDAVSAEMPYEIVQKNVAMSGQREIYLAGGCFWGTELYLSLVPAHILPMRKYAATVGMRRQFTSSMIRTSFLSSSF